MGVNWQKWVTEDLGLSLDDVSSVRISRDIAASDPFIDILTGKRWKQYKYLDTGKITLITKKIRVYEGAIDWGTSTIKTLCVDVAIPIPGDDSLEHLHL